MKAQIIKFLKEEDGITALEYGILAAIVAGVLVIVFGTNLKTVVFDPLLAKLAGVVADA
jgi:pilus assembly protein Flp/PilA